MVNSVGNNYQNPNTQYYVQPQMPNTVANAVTNPVQNPASNPVQAQAPVSSPAQKTVSNSAQNPNSVSGVTINCPVIDISKLSPEEREKYLASMQANNPQVNGAPCYPGGYYINNYANNNTVKKRIVTLTDDYVKNLDMMLSCDNSDYREYAASEVIKRLDEDKTRFNDKALNALINKMLLDPYDHKVRGRALTALENHLASGDENTRNVLQYILQDPNILDRDRGSVDKILLQMSANTTLVNAPITSGSTIIS